MITIKLFFRIKITAKYLNMLLQYLFDKTLIAEEF